MFGAEDGDGIFLRNTGIHLQVYIQRHNPKEHIHPQYRENLKSHIKSNCIYLPKRFSFHLLYGIPKEAFESS
jgi:hypothetical protein